MSKTKIARIMTTTLTILLVVSGVLGALRYGGICSLGIGQSLATNSWGFLFRSLDYWQNSVTCPLGFLERSLAVGELVPQWWVSVGLVILSVVMLGRVFCAWFCPTVLLHRIFGDKAELRSVQHATTKGTILASYSSYAVLGGALLASFLFRFPVFCMFCPIGLFFGVLYAVTKLFSPNPLSVELVLFPLVLGLEVFALKSWCRSICPLGALLSIFGNLNRILVPVLKKDKCLTSNGINCGACVRVCPEGIDLTKKSRFYPNSCTKCLECYEKCPVKAIKFPLWS